jgi:hypothetical protein
MQLEFELEKTHAIAKGIHYVVKRKGLAVGLLTLDADPYAQKEAEIRYMNCF